MDLFFRDFVRRNLDLPSRLEEVLFGLVMVLTVTLTAGFTASPGREGVRELLFAAVGCNIAWGIIDALMYVMGAMTERSRASMLLERIRRAPDPGTARAIAEEEIDARLGPVATRRAREVLAADIVGVAADMELAPPRLTGQDLRGAVACFWLVFISCLPAALPFLVLTDPVTALRLSNALLIAMLFGAGLAWASYTGANRIVAGGLAVTLGLVMVTVAILLGG